MDRITLSWRDYPKAVVLYLAVGTTSALFGLVYYASSKMLSWDHWAFEAALLICAFLTARKVWGFLEPKIFRRTVRAQQVKSASVTIRIPSGEIRSAGSAVFTKFEAVVHANVNATLGALTLRATAKGEDDTTRTTGLFRLTPRLEKASNSVNISVGA